MKHFRRCWDVAIVHAGRAAVLLWAGTAWAHGVGFERSSEPAEVVHFFYTGGGSMPYAAIKVFSPLDQKTEYQSGFADVEGRFAFVPNTAGAWRVVASDGMGHRAEMEILHQLGIPESAALMASATDDAAVSVWKAMLGLSLIFNLAFITVGATRYARQTGKEAAHASE